MIKIMFITILIIFNMAGLFSVENALDEKNVLFQLFQLRYSGLELGYSKESVKKSLKSYNIIYQEIQNQIRYIEKRTILNVKVQMDLTFNDDRLVHIMLTMPDNGKLKNRLFDDMRKIEYVDVSSDLVSINLEQDQSGIVFQEVCKQNNQKLILQIFNADYKKQPEQLNRKSMNFTFGGRLSHFLWNYILLIPEIKPTKYYGNYRLYPPGQSIEADFYFSFSLNQNNRIGLGFSIMNGIGLDLFAGYIPVHLSQINSINFQLKSGKLNYRYFILEIGALLQNRFGIVPNFSSSYIFIFGPKLFAGFEAVHHDQFVFTVGGNAGVMFGRDLMGYYETTDLINFSYITVNYIDLSIYAGIEFRWQGLFRKYLK